MINEYFQTIHQIITVGHRITDGVSRELKEYGISEPQYNVLRTLESAKGKPLAVEDILAKMVQRSSNVTRIVDKLISKGYVTRNECPTNRRKMDISITPEGLEALKTFDRKVFRLHRPMMKQLDEKELETLRRLIMKLTETENE